MKGDVEQKVNVMMAKKAELQDLERRLAQVNIMTDSTEFPLDDFVIIGAN